jgi:hypothetical protein
MLTDATTAWLDKLRQRRVFDLNGTTARGAVNFGHMTGEERVALENFGLMRQTLLQKESCGSGGACDYHHFPPSSVGSSGSP